jgi:hypothetical protein
MPTLPEHGAQFHDLPTPTGAFCNLDCKYFFFLSIPLQVGEGLAVTVEKP